MERDSRELAADNYISGFNPAIIRKANEERLAMQIFAVRKCKCLAMIREYEVEDAELRFKVSRHHEEFGDPDVVD